MKMNYSQQLLKERQWTEGLNRKYPHINAVEGEDLNIRNNINRMVGKAYMNVKKFPTIATIMRATGLSNSQVHIIAKRAGCISRTFVKESKRPSRNY